MYSAVTRPAVLVFMVAAAVGAASRGGAAEREPAGKAEEALESVFLPAPRVARQHLSRAQKAVQESRFGDAVAELGALLSGVEAGRQDGEAEEAQDFFLESAEGTLSSLKTEAQRLLGSMPPRGRELFELQFGAEARALLEAAVASGDWRKLHEVARRFFHTRAGYEAAVLLARVHLDQGQPLAAALQLQRVLEAPAAAPQFEPELSVLLAACYLQANRPDKAQQTLVNLRQRAPQARVSIGGQQPEALPPPSEALAWLERHFGAPSPSAAQPFQQWIVYRGDPARNGQSVAGLPLRNQRWHVATATDPVDEMLITELRGMLTEEDVPPLPSLHPLAVGKVILMRTPERLLAVDAGSGKRIWEYPWWDLSYQRALPADRAAPRPAEFEQRKQQLLQRLWFDAPYGQLSSDGRSVFLLDELRYAPASRFRFVPIPMAGRRGSPDAPQSYNQLVALDLRRQGALRWMVGGETGLDEPRLAGAFFLGPPLPLFGQLYVLAEVNGEIRLAVLDAESGAQEWSQQLAHVDTFTILDSPLRRLAGASPSFADGILVCPTSAGAVVAVDLSTRSLLWGRQYAPASAEQRQMGRIPSYPGQSLRLGSRWADATVTLADGAVLLTPPESNKLECLDLLTGRPKWPAVERSGPLADLLYVACVHRGVAVLVGTSQLVALRLSDGQPAWPEPLRLEVERHEAPSGRGYYADRYYYLPTTAARLLKIDLEEGRIVSSTSTDRVLGNLVCCGEQVVAQSVDCLASHYQVEPLRRRVAERLRTSPQDPWALARQAELLANDGDLDAALDSLQRALDASPQDPEIRRLAVKTCLLALRQDFSRHHPREARIRELIDEPRDEVDFLRALASGWHAAGHFREAWTAYLELADVMGREAGNVDTLVEPNVSADPAWSVRLDRWLQARVAELWRAADADLRRQMETALQSRLEGALAGPPRDLESFLRAFGFHPLAGPARLKRAAQLAEANEPLAAELLLAPMLESSDPTLAGCATARLAKLLQGQGKNQPAADCYRRLAARWSESVCDEGKTGRQLLEAAQAEGVLQAGARGLEDWPWGATTWQEAKDGLARQLYRRVFPIPLEDTQPLRTEIGSLAYEANLGSAVVRDGQGKPLFAVKVQGGLAFYGQQPGMSRAAALGHFLFITLADQLVAVDALRGARKPEEAVLWREALVPSVPDLGPQASARFSHRISENPLDPFAGPRFYLTDMLERPLGASGPLMPHGVCYQKVRGLVCADLLTGKAHWSRTDIEPGAEVFGDSEYVFVVGAADTQASMLNALDGSLLGRRPVPERRRRWATRGRFVLAWELVPEGVRLQLHDLARPAVVWSETFPQGSRGCLADGREVLVLQPNGRLLIRSLQDDRVVAERMLESEPKLASIHVLAADDRFLLFTNTDPGAGATAYSGVPMKQIRGRLYALDRGTGEPLWQVPAYIDGYMLPVDHPREGPALWLLRQYASRNAPANAPSAVRAAVVCLDQRTGRLLLHRADLQSQALLCEITADRQERTSRLTIPGYYSVTVKFTEEPLPPEPPAQTGSAASNFEQGASRLSEFANSLLKAIFGRAPSPPAPPGNQKPQPAQPLGPR